MTARISHDRRRNWPARPLRRGLLTAGAALGAWAIALSGTTPAAAADDVRSKQWYLDLLHAEEIWKKTKGEGIKVAVIDSGVNPGTPSLKGQVLKGVDATVEKGGSTKDTNGQGTTTAELIAGTGKGGGLQGLAPGAKIIPIRVPLLKHDELPPGKWIERDPLYTAIHAAVDMDADIITINVRNHNAIGNDLYNKSAAEYAASKGKLLIAGTGDNAKDGNKPLYPAAALEVTGVTSVDRKGNVADFSQYGEDVDLAAPGVDVPRWCNADFERYCDGGGASAAAALASASAALIWSAHPDWTANQVLRVLLGTTVRSEEKKSGVSKYLGYGIVRPGANILDEKGDPGSPKKHPLLSSNPLESGDSSAGSPDSKDRADKTGSSDSPSHAEAEPQEGSQFGLIAGIAAAVAVLAAGALALARKRRSA
ncbi:S8 family serine peptidase [Streptomyces sp. LHD-70]|uniref:S8 family serine peptidase n=1 Tax=Streptomyces sp. LHD-70 TaxID=3072140 RepID=UPI00280F081F|nr:S8 family serine peptidase [Streptomyces sp. LHD-70]MDQ8706843.1 S8 family serine peptidase [Streptomyces sp. LHD-70]